MLRGKGPALGDELLHGKFLFRLRAATYFRQKSHSIDKFLDVGLFERLEHLLLDDVDKKLGYRQFLAGGRTTNFVVLCNSANLLPSELHDIVAFGLDTVLMGFCQGCVGLFVGSDGCFMF